MCITSMKKKSYAQALLFGLASMVTSGVTAADIDINGGNVRGIRPTDEDMVKMMQHRLAKADKESSKVKKEPKASKAKGPSKASKAAEGVWVSNLQKTGTCENDGGTRSCESPELGPYPYAFSCYATSGEDTTVTQVRFWADQVGTKVDGKKPQSLVITGDEGRDFYFQELGDYNGGRNIIVLDDLKFFDQLDDGSDTISSVDGIGASISGAYFCVGLIPTFTGENLTDPISRNEFGIRSEIIDNADEGLSIATCASDDTIPNLDEYINIGDEEIFGSARISTFCIEAKVVSPSSKGRALALPQKEVPSKDAESPPPVERSLATVTPSADGWMSNLNTKGVCSNNAEQTQTCRMSQSNICPYSYVGSPHPYAYFAERFKSSGTKTVTQVKFWLDEVPVGSAPLNIVLANKLNGDVLYEQIVQTPQKGMNTIAIRQPTSVKGDFFVGVVSARVCPNSFVALQSETTQGQGGATKACECVPYGQSRPPKWVSSPGLSMCIEAYVGTGPSPPTPTPPTPTPPAPTPATCPIRCSCKFVPWACFGCYFAQCNSSAQGCGRGSNAFCRG